MPEPIPTNSSVNREGFVPPEIPRQQHEGPWRKENNDALRGYDELSNFKEPAALGTTAMDKVYGKHNWAVDQTAYAHEAGPDPFGRMPSEKADLLVSPDGDAYKAQQEQEK